MLASSTGQLQREILFTTLGWLQSAAWTVLFAWLWATGRPRLFARAPRRSDAPTGASSSQSRMGSSPSSSRTSASRFRVARRHSRRSACRSSRAASYCPPAPAGGSTGKVWSVGTRSFCRARAAVALAA